MPIKKSMKKIHVIHTRTHTEMDGELFVLNGSREVVIKSEIRERANRKNSPRDFVEMFTAFLTLLNVY